MSIEADLVTLDKNNRLKPQEDCVCYLVTKRAIVVRSLDGTVGATWYADEVGWNDLLPYADTPDEDDE